MHIARLLAVCLLATLAFVLGGLGRVVGWLRIASESVLGQLDAFVFALLILETPAPVRRVRGEATTAGSSPGR